MAFQPGLDNVSNRPYSVFSIWSPQTVPEAVVKDGVIQNSFSSLDIISRYGKRTYVDGKCVSISGLKVGDRKQIELSKGRIGTNSLHYIDFNENFTCYAEIIDFDHNAEKEGYGITFQISLVSSSIGFGATTDPAWESSAQSSTGGFYMNSTQTNSYGWAGSGIRVSVLGSSKEVKKDATLETVTDPQENTLMQRLPEDLRRFMKPIKKWTNNNPNGGNVNDASYCLDYLPLLAPYEIAVLQTGDTYPCSKESQNQEKYDYLIDGGRPKGRKFYLDDRKSVRQRLRSPALNSGQQFTGVNVGATQISSLGAVAGSYQGVPNCIAPIFLI